jgi:hypothetical protein
MISPVRVLSLFGLPFLLCTCVRILDAYRRQVSKYTPTEICTLLACSIYRHGLAMMLMTQELIDTNASSEIPS